MQNPRMLSPIWLCSDGAAGNVNQARALAAGLSGPETGPSIHELSVPASELPWHVRAFAPRFSRLSAADLAAIGSCNGPQPGDIAIGCGRIGAVLLDALKQRHRDLRTVQILHPRCALRRFDWVICPQHDHARGSNLLSLIGSLTAIDEGWLAQGQALAAAHGVKRLVLIGAPTRNAPYQLSAVLEAISALPRAGLCISASRRTPPEFIEHLQRLGVRLWRGPVDGANPYQAWLSAADEIWLTPDSVNMLSEASATHARLHILSPACARGKIAEYLRSLEFRLAGTTPFRPSQEIFATLRRALNYSGAGDE